MNVMTAEEVAARWRVSEDTVYRAIHAGKLKAFRIGRGLRIPEAEVERFENSDGDAL